MVEYTPPDFTGGLIRGNAYVNGLFDQHAKRKAGEAYARGDYEGASGLLASRGLFDQAEILRAQGVSRKALSAYNAGDTKAALGAAAGGGDADLYGKISTQEDTDRKEKAAWMGHATDALLQIKDPVQRHQAYVSAIAPTLKAMGMDPAEIDRIGAGDLSDENLTAFKTTLGQQSQLDIQKLDDGSIVGIDKRNGDVRVLHQGERKGVVVDNSVVDPVTGDVIYKGRKLEKLGEGEVLVDPSGQATGGASEGARNLRNNNPGNIEDGPFAQSMPGYKGSDGRFAIFDSPEAGTKAQTALLSSYGKRGIDTVSAIIGRWAPASDGNDVEGYSKYVAKRLGVKPDQKLDMTDPATLSDIAMAIKEFEGGSGSASNGPQIIARGKEKPKRSYVEATPDELKAAGYPAGTRAQKDSETGKFENIKQPTEAEVKNTGYANRVLGATDRINELFRAGIVKPSSPLSQMVKPDGHGFYKIVARSPADRRFVQAYEEWLAPILRKDTGAAVTYSEFEKYANMYMPNWEDDEALLQQKARARADAVRSMINETNGVFKATYGDRKWQMLMPAGKKRASSITLPSGRKATIELVE